MLPYCKLWIDIEKDVFCLIDKIDLEFALQWKWHTTANSTGKKLYVTRMTAAGDKQLKVYLHKEILIRSGVTPPSPAHTIADHVFGDSLDNRRAHLRWVTLSENNRNRAPRLQSFVANV